MSDTAILAELRRLADAVEGLRADVGLLASRGRLSIAERATLTALLPEAFGVVGDAEFTANDLLEVPRLAALLGGFTPSSVSWMLGRAEGSRIAGCRVERAGRDRAGTLWRLRREVVAPAAARMR